MSIDLAEEVGALRRENDALRDESRLQHRAYADLTMRFIKIQALCDERAEQIRKLKRKRWWAD